MKTEILNFDTNGNIAATTDVFARLLLVAIFFLAGTDKLSNYENTAGWMEAMGVPGPMLPLVIFAEIAGALAIIIGFQTRLAALGLAVFSIASALIFHNNIAEQAEFLNFFKNIAIAGGFLMLVTNGAKAFSLDARFNK